MLSSHVEISPLLWLHDKSRLLQSVWHFIGVYIINRTLPLGDMQFLFSCWKIFHSFAALTREFDRKPRQTACKRLDARGKTNDQIERLQIVSHRCLSPLAVFSLRWKITSRYRYMILFLVGLIIALVMLVSSKNKIITRMLQMWRMLLCLKGVRL